MHKAGEEHTKKNAVIFTSFIIKEMWLQNFWKWPVMLQGCAERNLNTTAHGRFSIVMKYNCGLVVCGFKWLILYFIVLYRVYLTFVRTLR